jgi:hypothetical protein
VCYDANGVADVEHRAAPEPDGLPKRDAGSGARERFWRGSRIPTQPPAEESFSMDAVTSAQTATGKKYFINIEGTEYEWPKDTITVPEIRNLGNLPVDLPVIEELPDGTERQLREDEVIDLKPGHRYGRAPKYKRG